MVLPDRDWYNFRLAKNSLEKSDVSSSQRKFPRQNPHRFASDAVGLWLPLAQKRKLGQTNQIFPEIFIESLCRINPDLSPDDARRLLTDIGIELDNEDLGQKFYERLTNQSGGKKLIDFQNFNNNSFHVVTELSCINGDEEFRPDITLLVNGMLLVFIEVKKPNNKGGIGEERERMGKHAKIPNSAVSSTSPNS